MDYSKIRQVVVSHSQECRINTHTFKKCNYHEYLHIKFERDEGNYEILIVCVLFRFSVNFWIDAYYEPLALFMINTLIFSVSLAKLNTGI